MSPDIARRLQDLGVSLPSLPPPQFNYVPGVVVANLVFASGQTPTIGGRLAYSGRLGDEIDAETGKQAAALAALNVLAELEQVAGLENIVRIARLTGYVASADGFVDAPDVVNGASDLMVDVLGDPGRHSRVAIGVAWLPGNAPVEIEVIAEIG